MDAKERIIRSLELFDGCSGAELRWAMKHGDLVDVRDGTVLAREGAYAHEFVVIVDGVASSTRDGCSRVVRRGSWFGDDEITDDRPHLTTVVARDGLRVLAFEIRAFRGFAESVPTVARKLSGARTDVATGTRVVRRLATAS